MTKITHIDEVNGDVDGDDRNGADIDSIDEVNGDDGREGDGSPPLQLWIDAQWGCYNVALYISCLLQYGCIVLHTAWQNMMTTIWHKYGDCYTVARCCSRQVPP